MNYRLTHKSTDDPRPRPPKEPCDLYDDKNGILQLPGSPSTNILSGMKRTLIMVALLIIPLTAGIARGEEYLPDSMKTHPEWYIKVSDWSVYATWGGVAIIQGLTIENTSDIPYRDVKVRVTYSSNAAGGAGGVVNQEAGVLPITLPAKSKDTYLKAGYPFGAGSQFMNPLSIQVLGATPVFD